MSLTYANYHTHTFRCRHAQGLDSEYVEAALKAGFRVLGFSDHCPWPFSKEGYVSGVRMLPEQLDDYLSSVHFLKEQYQGRISIHTGLEAEYYTPYTDWLYRMRDRGVEYFILGQHFCDTEEFYPPASRECENDEGVLRYAETVCKALRTGLFSYVAHPDLFMSHRTDDEFSPACEQAADCIVQTCLEMHIPVEYNLLGLRDELDGHSRGYPSAAFWSHIRSSGCPVIIGEDAHSPDAMLRTDAREEAHKRLRELGLTVISALPMDEPSI